jgi:hypothetical protein
VACASCEVRRLLMGNLIHLAHISVHSRSVIFSVPIDACLAPHMLSLMCPVYVCGAALRIADAATAIITPY